MPPAPLLTDWSERIPTEQWVVYEDVLAAVRARDLRFALGGALALASYTGELRNTKDLDLYICPEDRHEMIAALHDAGLTDLHERQPYDRAWIFRAARGEIIVDAIWAFANLHGFVDEHWLSHGRELTVHGTTMRAIPAEELLWAKLYVLQRERCDWTDILNLLDAEAHALDWPHLLRRVDRDARLLAAVLDVFAWLVPDRARVIPHEVWDCLGVRAPHALDGSDDLTTRRAALLDSRPWFRINHAARARDGAHPFAA